MAQFWIRMAIFVLAFCVDSALSEPINVVLVTDKDDSIAKTAIRFGIEKDEGAEPKFKFDVVGLGRKVKTEADICKKIFGEGRSPHLVIDATKEYNGTKPIFAKRSQMLKLLLRKMGAPTVSFTPTLYAWPGPTLTDAEKEYILSFIPPEMVISNVVKSVVDVIGTQKIGVVYDQTFPFTNIAGLLFDNIPSAIAMIPLSYNIKDTVRKIKISDLGNIFVFASEINLNALVELISSNELVSNHYAWFTISKDGTDIKSSVKNEFTLLHFKPKEVNSNMEKALGNFATDAKVDSGFYHDLAVIFREYLLENVGKEASWPSNLTYPECADEIVLTEEMIAERSAIKMRSAIEAMESSKGLKGTFGDFKLKSAHPRGMYGFQNIKMKVQKVTLGSAEPVIKSEELFWQFQADQKPASLFSGSTNVVNNHKGAMILRITTVEEPPFMYKTMTKDGKVKWVGYCMDLIEMLKKEANLTFEYRITENKEKLHGDMKENRNKKITFNGMMGDIIEGRADLALAPMAVMPERELFVDFTVPFYDMVGISVLMKIVKPHTSLFKFLSVLEDNVWACILVSYFVTSFLLYIFDRLSPYSFYNNQEKFKDEEETRDFTFKESLWFCITSLTPQGGGEAPRSLSGRMVAGTWWLFGFIIVASYTANLAAFLTVSRVQRTVDSFDALVRQYKYKFSVVEGSMAHTYFERMANIEERFYEIWKNMSLDDDLNATERSNLAVWDYPVSDKYTKIWWSIQEYKIYKTLEEGINKTRASTLEEGYSVLAIATQVQYATMLHCDLRQVGQQFSRKPLSLALPKGSPLREPLSNAILKLMNERVLEKLKDKWWNENPFVKKCKHHVKRNDGVELDNLGGIFIISGGGLLMALITLLIEYIYFKHESAFSRVIKVKDVPEAPFRSNRSDFTR